MIREPQRLLRGACERRAASAIMQARRIHVAASRCRRDRVAMRAPPVRRREPCCVCARAAAASIEEVRLEWKTACYYGPCFTYFFIAHSSSATCGLFVCVFRFFFIARSPAGMRAVFSHRPVPPIRVVASKKEKKSRFSLHVRYYSRTQSWSPGGVVGAWSARFTYPCQSTCVCRTSY